MCISPILIKNPNLGLTFESGKYPFNKFKDTTSRFISVPCGNCPQCLHNKQSALVSRSQLQSFDHYFFFCTLTYNPEHLPVFTKEDFSTPYARRKDFQLFVKRLRNLDVFGRPFKYLAVSEFGSKKHRPHWHILFAVKKFDSDNDYTPINMESVLYQKVLSCWVYNSGSKRVPVYSPLLTLPRRHTLRSTYDFHFVAPRNGSGDDVHFYVTKYVLKPDKYVKHLQSTLVSKFPESYKSIWSVIKPKLYMSKGYGFPDTSDKFKYLRLCIDQSKDFPTFFNPVTGQSFPLCKYLRKPSLKFSDLERFSNSFSRDASGRIIFVNDRLNVSEHRSQLRNFERQINLINTNSYD